MPPKKASLRAVGPDDVADLKPEKAKTVSDAAENGTTRELLVAMRNRIAKAVEDPNTPARDLAALTKRLTEVVRDVEAIDAREDADGDEDAGSADDTFDASAI